MPDLWLVALGLWLPMAVLVWNMVQVRSYTVDDAYISYRYARNLARGLGLVYNPGEYIEGYTNFLWTALLGLGFRFNLDPDAVAKTVGGLASCGSLYLVFVLSRQLRPYASVPCVATWLMASSIVQSGYAVFGLETSAFTFLILAGSVLFFREQNRETAFPFSGLVFALAGLTRPEAPMFVGILMLPLGRRFFGRQNLLRGALFVAPIAAHVLWRYSYYDAWLPNTLAAKTGDLGQQLTHGSGYIVAYARHAWPVLVLTLVGIHQARGVTFNNVYRLAVGVLCYVLVVGGDWMPFFRFLAPFEPFCFVLACVGTRSVLEAAIGFASHRKALVAASWAVAIAGLVSLGVFRTQRLNDAQKMFLERDKVFWDSSAGEVATWLILNDEPGEVAMGDIGYIGYATDYPVLDLLGLVDPVISKLPGGYTHKTGPDYVKRVFDRVPKYFVFVGSPTDCSVVPFPRQEQLRTHEQFQRSYELAAMIRHSKRGVWCIFERIDGAET